MISSQLWKLLRSTGAWQRDHAAPSRRSPYFNMVEETPDGASGCASRWRRRCSGDRTRPGVYDMNASIYVWRSDVFRDGASIFRPDTRLYVMPEERSVDIDTETDWLVVEMLMSRRLAA
jgi:N-acylneuraminate cytidylyltransferase/CMP-N,N'-diacetyllegionaminic acid synthase